jgi:sulfopyruvate decarboxylase TPP-binding subunit
LEIPSVPHSELLKQHSIPGSAALAALQRNAVDHVVTVPDWVQLSLHHAIEAPGSGIRQINTANENQAVTTAAGLTLGGKKPLLLMQNQGLYNCINTVRAVCIDGHIPLVFMVGQFGREFDNLGQTTRHSRRSMVRLMEPVLDALQIPYLHLESVADLPMVDKAYTRAQETQTAVVLVVGAPMAWA